MVELINDFVVDLIDQHSFTNEATVSVRNGDSVVIEDDRLVTHKRVCVELDILESDPFDKTTTTIGLSPLMALALVRRLIDCLDGLGLDCLPQAHGRFTRLLIDHLNGVEVDDDVLHQISMIEAASSMSVNDGAVLEDILPPSLQIIE